MLIGASKVYVASPAVYHNCSNVVSPRNNPKVEFATKVAADPVDGIIKEYSSLRDPSGAIASEEMLPALTVFRDKVSCSDCNSLAPCRSVKSEAPRPTTKRPSLSFFKYDRVRATACVRSSGMSEICISMEKEGLRSREVFPVCSERGIGHRAKAPGVYLHAIAQNDST